MDLDEPAKYGDRHGEKYCWMDGKIIDAEDAVCSVLSPMFLGVFEGIKCYTRGKINLNEGNLNIFRWWAHIDRFWDSAMACGFRIEYTQDQLLEAVRATIRANKLMQNASVQLRLWPKERGLPYKAYHVVIPITPFQTRLGKGNLEFSKRLRYMVSSWRRISSDSLPPQIKCWANYANSELGAREAFRLGYDGCVFLDRQGFVSESPRACIVGIKDGVLITPPLSASILESVTRSSLLTFCEDLGMTTDVRVITRVELYSMDEVFLCGTRFEVTPIASIDDIDIGEDFPGPITTKLAEYYADVLVGNVRKYQKWLTPV
jgi:branched-chain amino acid aminotransferase